MALFKLTDIIFNKETQGPLTKLEDSQGLGVNSNILKYPSDLGNYDKGHYMIIYVNEQVNTQYSDGPAVSVGSPTIQRAREAIQSQRGPINLGQNVETVLNTATNLTKQALASETAQALASAAKTAGQAANKALPLGAQDFLEKTNKISNTYIAKAGDALGDVSAVLQSGSFLRKIRRTKQAIALYMPDTLNFVYNQSYNDLNVFDTTGNVGTALAAGASLSDAISNGAAQKTPINVASFGLQFLKQAGGKFGNFANLGLAQLGVASNPGLELIYGSPSFRSFRFDFLFYPRSRQEGEAVQAIINSLKFHQAPEFATQTGGRFLIPPSEFDIEFYYNGQVNKNIPKISTCVLTSIDLDYAPNGFAAYEIPQQGTSIGGTGMPVAIRMSLNFKETQIVTKEYLRWASTDASGPTARTSEEIAFANSLGDFNG